MDDFLILSTDKERLRKIWRLLEQILKEEYLLKLNPKTEIFPCRRGFNFLGYRFRVINNRLQVGMARKTRLRVRRRLAESRASSMASMAIRTTTMSIMVLAFAPIFA